MLYYLSDTNELIKLSSKFPFKVYETFKENNGVIQRSDPKIVLNSDLNSSFKLYDGVLKCTTSRIGDRGPYVYGISGKQEEWSEIAPIIKKESLIYEARLAR